MSLKSLLMPMVSQRLLPRPRLLAQRARDEKARVARGERHYVHYFHQVDDPYSALAASILPQLLARYDIALIAHVAGVPPDSAAPQRERLVAYSRRDAQMLARQSGLDFTDPGMQPSPQATHRVRALLVGAMGAGRFAQLAGALSHTLWRDPGATGVSAVKGETWVAAAPETVAQHMANADALRQRLGHYLGATFFYAGEWYWGVDRLHHLEARLQDLGAQRAGVSGSIFTPPADLAEATHAVNPAPIDFFLSLRSPYTAIVTPRIVSLSRLTGAPLRLRYVLPMVMRGLAVPREKRMYISLDAAREAHARGIAFGRLNDPLGRPTERGLALMPLAERRGLGEAYLVSFMRGVWSEGLDAGSERGLRRIAQRAGLNWDEAKVALQDEGWRAIAEANRAEMFALGLWGVPSFRVGEVSTWGQDRLWVVEQALLGRLPSATPQGALA
ncbi:MAG: DsbA family protein [Burkholderiaceae bacterium]